MPVVRLFLPCTGFSWLLSEIDPYELDVAFGLCDLGMGCPELKKISLSELEELQHPYWDISVESDVHFRAKYPISVYAEAALIVDRITEDDKALESQNLKSTPNSKPLIL